MKTLKLGPQDCMVSLALREGFFYGTIWDHPDNAALRDERKDPNSLLEGDEVVVPDRTTKLESVAAEQRHRYRRKGVPAAFRLVLLDASGNPRSRVKYQGKLDGRLVEGSTDGSGLIEIPLAGDEQRLILRVLSEDGDEVYPISLGRLDPVTEISGVQARLLNLGFDCGEVSGVLNDQTREALHVFQRSANLDETGEPDEATRTALTEEHGS